jgi:hypothetical protein
MRRKYTYEFIKSEFEKRGYKLLENNYINTDIKMRYKCSKHPDKELSICYYSLKSGSGCPYCAKERIHDKLRLSFDKVKSKFEEKDYILLDKKYINYKTPLRYKCKKHPDIIQKISYCNLYNGSGCRFCGLEKRSQSRKFPFEFIRSEFEKRGYKLLETQYINSETKMKYQCLVHPDKILYIDYNHLRIGVGCPYCGGTKKLTYEYVKDEFEKRGYQLLEKEYINSRTLMLFRCPEHPDKITKISYGHLGQGGGCVYCSKERSSNKQKIEYDVVKREFENRGYELLDTTYNKAKEKLRYQCLNHKDKIQYISYDKLKRGEGCVYCTSSKGERRIIQILNNNNIEYHFQYKFPDCRYKYLLRFDFYIPSYNLCIEYQGEQHYEPRSFNWDKNDTEKIEFAFSEQQKRDKMKRNYCCKNKIKLLEIPYWEYDNIEAIINKYMPLQDTTTNNNK